MRDFAVVLMAVFVAVAAWRVPWHGVLGLAFFGYASPHRYAWSYAYTLPVYQTILFVVFLAAFRTKDRQPIPSDWRIKAFYLLWAWFLVTTIASPIGWAAWPKLWDVSKVYIPLVLTLILINNREKLFWLLATIGLSFGVVAAKGGIFAITRGFHYRVWGPEGTMYGGNNEFSIATLASIPLLVLMVRRLKGEAGWKKWLRWLAIVTIPLAFASAISSWSRGGMLTLLALVMVLWWHSRHKILFTLVLIVAGYFAPSVVPHEWVERMETIQHYEEDGSAMGRIEAWQDGLNFIKDHPILGAGFDGWRYVTKRDWHSSYIEILVEHGIPGALLWGLLIFGSLASLTRLIGIARKDPKVEWARDYAIMIRASIIAYLGGSATLGITYWDLIYQLVFCAVLLKQFVMAEHAPAFSPSRHGGSARRKMQGAPRPLFERAGRSVDLQN